ncbi:hypothetical protein BD779DRAFT_1791760 [Infundibulicybe gibba]|nr:hypothetical protein BD779DRAFT_1791760 [Infundibulicybe gibba]
MNNLAPSSAITTLRSQASKRIRDLYADFTLYGCLPQHPSFPYSDVNTELVWLDEGTSVRHSYPVDFRFRRRLEDPTSPVTWTVVSNIGTLGRVELDPHLFHPQHGPINAELILRCMRESITLGEKICVSSRVFPDSSGTLGLAADSNMEVIEMRTWDWTFVKQLDSRVIPKRACVVRCLDPSHGHECVSGTFESVKDIIPAVVSSSGESLSPCILSYL